MTRKGSIPKPKTLATEGREHKIIKERELPGTKRHESSE